MLFSAPMVRACLNDSKTQTRRIVRPMRGFAHNNICRPDMAAEPGAVWWHGASERVGCLQACPYGVPGDRLWVKETWRTLKAYDALPPSRVPREGAQIWCDADGKPPAATGWGRTRQSIFMPRWASRLTLEVVSVRVERLQEITEADALAEGVSLFLSSGDATWPSARDAYRALWGEINGSVSWGEDPWVRVVGFRRLA